MATLTKGKTFTNGETVTPQKLHELVDLGTVSGIVNADIAAGAAIADSKLAQITTAGKVLPAAVQGTAVVTADPRLSDARMPVPHTHAISDTTGLQTALDGKQAAGSYAAASHTHDDRYYTETEMNTLLAGKQASGSYAPATGIAQSAVTNLTTDLAGKAASSHTHDDRYYTESEIDTKLSGLPVSGHTHTIANVTGLQAALDGKQASGSYAAASHTHDDRYYTETEMNTLLAGKQASGSYAPASHGHAISDTTGLQTALDSKVSGSNLGLVKAWVNFNHGRMLGVTNAANGESIAVTAGSSSGTWNSTTAFSTGQIGIIYYVTSAGAVPNASLGGINVSTLGFQIRAISGNTATISLLAGPATSSQTISGNGGTSGFQYISYGIRSQYGVASIIKTVSGTQTDFTFNFSTAFNFIDYCYFFQLDAKTDADIYIQTKGQSSIMLRIYNFNDSTVCSQMNFMALGI